jgi:predicted aldo/keto reductase-like oxidoreductase
MQYRRFGPLDWQASVLGFGCMRFPTTDGDPLSGNIDEGEATNMLRFAIDQGVNYVDTAYSYHCGMSETVVGKALQGGYRERVKLASKSPVWMIGKTADFDNYLNEQLKKLQTDHIDFYLLHALSQQQWDNIVLRLNLLDRVEAALQDGRIRHVGFSCHDRYPGFEAIINGYSRWTFCQIQYNYMDTEKQAGTKGLQYAAAKGLAVVIMEPLLGGRLANSPRQVQECFNAAQVERSSAEWALQWVWDHPEVSVVLSGMHTMKQVEENINSASLSRAGALSAADLQLIARVRQIYEDRTAIPCTRCGYCMPCPNGVNIPGNFEQYNGGFIHDDLENARSLYTRYIRPTERASACVQCGECEEKCPQKIPISEWMSMVHAVLEEGRAVNILRHHALSHQ